MSIALTEPVGHDLKSFVPDLKAWAAAHPRTVFALLRRLAPIFVHKGQAIVTRYADVQEVLARDEVFDTTYASGFEALTGGGNFFLGMDDTPTYTRDLSNMRTVVRREDITDRVGAFTVLTAERLVADAPGTIDVVDLGHAVLTAWVADYFGIVSPTPQAFAQWAATMSGYLFLKGLPGAPPESAAVDAGARMCAEIDRQIAARKAARTGGAVRDDVLERCLVMQDAGLPGMDDVTVRNNLLGLIVGAMPTSVTCMARALDELLRRPGQLAGAQDAANRDNDALVQQYVFEALRFNPLGPGVQRVARRDYQVAAGNLRARVIPHGTTVIVAILSAMFDKDAFEDPNDFRIDRPPYVSLLFGFGRHTCFGQYINAVQIPAVVKAVLKQPNLRRAGELVLDGVFPSSLRVEFDTAQATSAPRSASGSTGGRDESALPAQRSVGGGITAPLIVSPVRSGPPPMVLRRLRVSLILGAMVDVLGGVPLLLFPNFMERFLGLPVPQAEVLGNHQFWPAYAAVFLFVLPLFYLLTAANPARYLGNVVVSVFGRALGGAFYATYYFEFGAHFPFLVLAALNLAFAVYYAWSIVRVGAWHVMDALAPAALPRRE